MNFKLITKKRPLFFPDVKVKGVVVHWTAGTYYQFFPTYHFCIDKEGSTYQNMDWFKEKKIIWTLPNREGHTWHRNSGRIGITVCAMYGATPSDYGKYLYTKKQMESMCALSAQIVKKYKIVLDEVKTHSEWAVIDGYGLNSGDSQTKWDFFKEKEIIKKKTLWYLGAAK